MAGIYADRTDARISWGAELTIVPDRGTIAFNMIISDDKKYANK